MGIIASKPHKEGSFLSMGWLELGDGDSHARILPPPAFGLFPPSTEWRGEKHRVYNNLGKEVTPSPFDGEGDGGWGFPSGPALCVVFLNSLRGREILFSMGRVDLGGWGFRRPNPHPALRAPLPTRWGGEKRRVYNEIGKEVTLPHPSTGSGHGLVGKGWGWGLPR